MEQVLSLICAAFLGFLLLRMMLLPLGWLGRMVLRGGSGFLCLWLLNTVSGFTGLLLPINPLTVLAAGFLGIPGIGGIALLELLG